MNGETQESKDCKRDLRLQKRREQAEQVLQVLDLPVMRQTPTRAKAVGLEKLKQGRKHKSGSKPNYRDMPADVSVK